MLTFYSSAKHTWVLFAACHGEDVCVAGRAHPGTPADSMRLARDTSCDHTSYCHFLRPITPHSTFPEWIPTLMLMSTPVASLTCLGRQQQIRPDLAFSLLFLLRFSLIIHLVQRRDKLIARTVQLQLINTL